MNCTYHNMSMSTAIGLVTVFSFCAIGWLMNFQNLWEYWPETGKFADVSMPWIASTIGIVIPIIGTVTGWIF